MNCEYCGKEFLETENCLPELLIHMALHDPEDINPQDPNLSYSCIRTDDPDRPKHVRVNETIGVIGGTE